MPIDYSRFDKIDTSDDEDAPAGPEAAQQPSAAPFQLPLELCIHGCWHVLAEGYWMKAGDGRWSWDYAGVDCIRGSIVVEQRSCPELYVDVYLVDPATDACYGAFSNYGAWNSETEITFKDSAGGWWKAKYESSERGPEHFVSCVASADPLASLEKIPGPLDIDDECWHGFMSECDDDFVAMFNGAAGAPWMGEGPDHRPRAQGSCPHARLAHLRRLLATARVGGALPVLANFAFERSAGETASP